MALHRPLSDTHFQPIAAPAAPHPDTPLPVKPAHLLDNFHAQLEVCKRLDDLAVDRLDAGAPRVVEDLGQGLHGGAVHLGRVGRRRAGHEQRLGGLDELDHGPLAGVQLLLDKDRLDRVEQLVEVARLLAARAALGEHRGDELVVVDEEGRLLLERGVLPRQPFTEELLDLGPEDAEDVAHHRLHHGRLEQPERRDQLGVPARDVVRRRLGRLGARHEAGHRLDVRLHDGLEARPNEHLCQGTGGGKGAFEGCVGQPEGEASLAYGADSAYRASQK
eukprot:scaffold12862_cov116-Isochrysis_galbana.AAC.11